MAGLCVVILRRFINIYGYLASECDEGDNAGEMSPGSNTESYPAFAHIGLRENPEKTSTRNCEEQETLTHVLGFCRKGELLRTGRHNKIHSMIANEIRRADKHEVYEEIGCLSADGSTRRADILVTD
ncbi:hypothetical protein ANN_01115 [Periplaneta americana]|uniref:Uncharacterized protein n=1 Tax=Periplaneta americana TaxID=6978 RepID=A0ABQ8TSN6_PERAM|nr:hypothetical protein ANN_01115 [Periplaneta americana]